MVPEQFVHLLGPVGLLVVGQLLPCSPLLVDPPLQLQEVVIDVFPSLYQLQINLAPSLNIYLQLQVSLPLFCVTSVGPSAQELLLYGLSSYGLFLILSRGQAPGRPGLSASAPAA